MRQKMARPPNRRISPRLAHRYRSKTNPGRGACKPPAASRHRRGDRRTALENGEVERFEKNIRGIAVHIGARVAVTTHAGVAGHFVAAGPGAEPGARIRSRSRLAPKHSGDPHELPRASPPLNRRRVRRRAACDVRWSRLAGPARSLDDQPHRDAARVRGALGDRVSPDRARCGMAIGEVADRQTTAGVNPCTRVAPRSSGSAWTVRDRHVPTR